MLRGGLLLTLVGTLGIVGYLLSAQSKTEGPSAPRISSAIEQGASEAATANLRQAAAALEQFQAANGTYAGAGLGGFGVSLARADENAYCIQAGVAPALLHETGPGGAPAPGSC